MAEATIFITGANEWRQFDQWPPAAKKDKVLYFYQMLLQSNGILICY
jgi:predicted acyl esterase